VQALDPRLTVEVLRQVRRDGVAPRIDRGRSGQQVIVGSRDREARIRQDRARPERAVARKVGRVVEEEIVLVAGARLPLDGEPRVEAPDDHVVHTA